MSNSGCDEREFWKECGYGDLQNLKRLVERGVDVNCRGQGGLTGLMIAILFDKNPSLVEFLIEKGVDWTLENQNGDRAIHIAARAGKTKYVAMLLAAGETSDGVEGGKLLCCAAASGNVDLVGFLIEVGVAVDSLDDRGDTALHDVTSRDAAEYLLDVGARALINLPNSDSETPLYRAAAGNRYGVSELLLSQGAMTDVLDAENAPAILRAAEKKYYDIVSLLLDAGASTEFVTSYGATLQSVADADPGVATVLDAFNARKAIMEVVSDAIDNGVTTQ